MFSSCVSPSSEHPPFFFSVPPLPLQTSLFINMSANSFFAYLSLDTPLLFINSSLHILECSKSRLSILIFSAFSITNILILLPLFTFILYLGLQRWKQQRSVSTAAATTSHSDVFTFHLVAMEMVTVSGSFLFCFGR